MIPWDISFPETQWRNFKKIKWHLGTKINDMKFGSQIMHPLSQNVFILFFKSFKLSLFTTYLILMLKCLAINVMFYSRLEVQIWRKGNRWLVAGKQIMRKLFFFPENTIKSSSFPDVFILLTNIFFFNKTVLVIYYCIATYPKT